MKKHILTATVSALALCVAAGGATAAEMETETVTTTTTTKTFVQQKPLPNTTEINFNAFDINEDGILSMPEVGEKLFYIFDTDGNEVIDNIEFDNPRVITIVPMEKHTLKMVDFDSDGYAEVSTYDYATFIDTTGLSRFDTDMDGLSAAEFINENFYVLDKDDDQMIEPKEWQAGYIKSRAPEAAEQERYN